jgi:hypothetical protein
MIRSFGQRGRGFFAARRFDPGACSRREDAAARVESAIRGDVVDLAAPNTDIEEFAVTRTV